MNPVTGTRAHQGEGSRMGMNLNTFARGTFRPVGTLEGRPGATGLRSSCFHEQSSNRDGEGARPAGKEWLPVVHPIDSGRESRGPGLRILP